MDTKIEVEELTEQIYFTNLEKLMMDLEKMVDAEY
jgi:hypothetical protein